MTASLPRTPTRRRLTVYAWPVGAAAVMGGALILLFAPPPGADAPPGWGPPADAAAQATGPSAPDNGAATATPRIPSANETPRAADAVAGFAAQD